jgi:hypothetical protein
MMGDTFLNRETWAPGGFVSPMDEYVQQHAISNALVWPMNFYAYRYPFDGRQLGDESYGGNSYQYIPTEVQVNAAIAIRNMASAGELPTQSNDPGMTQLLQSLYQKTASFWSDIRSAAGTGWGSGEE